MTRTACLALFLFATAPAVVGCLEVQDFGTATRQVIDSGPASPPGFADAGEAGTVDAGTPRWDWVNPLPRGGNLRAVWALADNDVWVTGTGGAVLRWDGTTVHDMFPDAPDETFYGVWASADDDVWIIGDSGGGGVPIYHWDGTAWRSDFAPDYGPVAYTSIWGASSSAVWIAAAFGISFWNGSTWAVQAGGGNEPVNPHDLWGTGPTNVWAAADYGLWHFDGTTWQGAMGPSLTSPGSWVLQYRGVWGSSPTDVWAFYEAPDPTGQSSGEIGFAHYDGNVWTLQDQTSWIYFGDTDGALSSALCGHRMWGTGTGSAFALLSVNFNMGGAAWSLANGHWAPADPIPAAPFPVALASSGGPVFSAVPGSMAPFQSPASGAWAPTGEAIEDDLVLVSVDRDGDVWALGHAPRYEANEIGFNATDTLHWSGSSWTKMPTPGEPPDMQQLWLTALWVNAADDVWVATENDSTYVYSLLHWNGQTWTTALTRYGGDLTPNGAWSYIGCLWGDGADDVWAVADNILHWNGTTWTVVPFPEPGPYEGKLIPSGGAAIWGTAEDDLWIVGSDAGWLDPAGTGAQTFIFHWDGSALRTVRSDIEPPWWGNLEPPSLWASGSDDAWLGWYGGLLHWNGSTWTTFSGGATGLWGSGPDDLWMLTPDSDESLVPSGTSIRHWDGQSFATVLDTAMPGPTLYAMAGQGGSNAWAVGAAGATLEFHVPAAAGTQ